MTKKTKLAILFSAPIIIGAYFIYRQFKGKKTYTAAVKQQGGQPNEQPNVQTPFAKYIVETLVTALNVREQPSVTSAKIGSVAKGSQIFARPSSTSGWFEYSSNGTTKTGYVSADYLKKA